MKTKSLISLLTAASIGIASIGNAIACTALLVTDVNGNAYKGRGWELGFGVPSMISYLPAGKKIESMTPSGASGKTFTTKYPILGVSLAVLPNAKLATFVDGLNDQGLTISLNALNDSSSPPTGSDNSKILAASDLSAWILGNFKNVAEVKAALLSDDVQVWLPKVAVMGDVPFPVHYAIWDKSGSGIVLEFLNGKKNVYDNPVNVLTNGPEFPWHLTNLNNYTFTNKDKNTGQLGKLKLATQDAGIALSALPSAQTATGRFVKAAFYANYVRKGKTPDEAIVTLGHIMNNFDRPYDLTVDGAGGQGDGPRGNSLSSETSRFIVMNDLAGKRFFFRDIGALNWAVIDMDKLKNITQLKTIPSSLMDKAGADAFNLFYK